MTYIHYEVFDKAITVDPLFKKLDARLAQTSAHWTPSQALGISHYAHDARDFFKSILLESLTTSDDFTIDSTSYPPLSALYPFTAQCNFGDPFEGVVREAELESVEKLVCLILFAEHILAVCEAKWPGLGALREVERNREIEAAAALGHQELLQQQQSQEGDESGEEYSLMEYIHEFTSENSEDGMVVEPEDRMVKRPEVGLRIEIEPTSMSAEEEGMFVGMGHGMVSPSVDRGIEEMLKLVASKGVEMMV